MKTQVVRFKELTLTPHYTPDPTIPEEAYQAIVPSLYVLMAPPPLASPEQAHSAIVTDRNFMIGIIQAPPGKKSLLHVHAGSTEIFLCLTGRFRARSRDDRGMAEAVLEPLDMIAIPAGTARDLENISGETALMLVLIVEDPGVSNDDTIIDAEESRALVERLGPELLKKLSASTGFRFDLPPALA